MNSLAGLTTTWSIKSLKELLTTRLNSLAVYRIPGQENAATGGRESPKGRQSGLSAFHAILAPAEGLAWPTTSVQRQTLPRLDPGLDSVR